MSLADIENYESAIQALRLLFGEDQVRLKYERLEEIFEESESCWRVNLEHFAESEARFLLLAEAPPWRRKGEEVSYFYRNFEAGTAKFLRRAVWKCFFGEKPLDYTNGLEMMARQGFLLIDVLPFAMRYTSTIRNEPAYKTLTVASWPFLLSKLRNAAITWSKDVRVAFAFKLPGQIAVEAIGKVTLPTKQVVNLNLDMIAADGSGYTSAKDLRRIFFDQTAI